MIFFKFPQKYFIGSIVIINRVDSFTVNEEILNNEYLNGQRCSG